MMAYLCVSSGKWCNRGIEPQVRGMGETGHKNSETVEQEDKTAWDKL
jgi:hypothetical protein